MQRFTRRKLILFALGVFTPLTFTTLKVENNTFMISVIDHTFHHTNLKFLKKSDQVNIEFDYLARFILNNE